MSLLHKTQSSLSGASDIERATRGLAEEREPRERADGSTGGEAETQRRRQEEERQREARELQYYKALEAERGCT